MNCPYCENALSESDNKCPNCQKPLLARDTDITKKDTITIPKPETQFIPKPLNLEEYGNTEEQS